MKRLILASVPAASALWLGAPAALHAVIARSS